MKLFYKLLVIALLLSLLVPSIAVTRRPKLILIIVVDQFRYDYLTRFRADYRGGIAHLLEEGAVFTDAHYPQYPTVTAVGHSTVLSGATPSVSGIIGNEWWDRGTNKLVTSVSDDTTLLLGADPAAKGSSPRRLLVNTLADELKMTSKSSTVIGISIKDRAAILPVGHMANAAYWFDGSSNHFVSSTYYFSQDKPKLPEWVTKANEGWQVSRFDIWSPVDVQPGVKDFCSLKRGTCGRIESTPFANELLEEFAEKAIAGEHLGTHGPDILSVSFSANDYVGHRYGPDSEQVHDISIRTDRLLDKLFQFIDKTIGLNNVIVVFTADHGVAPIPPENNSQHFPGGLLDANTYSDKISEKLALRFRSVDWFLCSSNGFLYLNYEAVDHASCKAEAAGTSSQCRVSAEEVRRVAAEEARKLPNIARVFTRDQLSRGEGGADPVGRAVQLGFNDVRSADLILVPEPYFMFKGEKNCKLDPEQEKTTHFTPYNYDSHVPLIFYGGGIPAGIYSERVAVNDVAPTLAALLDLESPSGSSGRILPQILKRAKLRKVVAGGQTGVDQAALKAADEAGLEIGGWCPQDCKDIEKNISPFPLQPTPEERILPNGRYVARSLRTAWNVRDSDATLILVFGIGPCTSTPNPALFKDDAGTAFTVDSAKEYTPRPLLVCDPEDPGARLSILRWIQAHDVEVLNVAGRADHPNDPGEKKIGKPAKDLLAPVFGWLQGGK